MGASDTSVLFGKNKKSLLVIHDEERRNVFLEHVFILLP
jgi:hypothetical protein